METISILVIAIIGGLAGALVAGLVFRDISLGLAGNCLAGVIGGCLGGQMIELSRFGPWLHYLSELAAGSIFAALMVIIFGFIRKSNRHPGRHSREEDSLMVDSQFNL